MTIKMNVVASSSLAEIGYKRRTMNVKFNTGRIYEFKKVPRKVFDEFKDAPSKGSYFNTNIKDLYPSMEM